MTNPHQGDDYVVWRSELQAHLRVHSETMRRWMRDGKIPAPDVALSRKTLGWKLSTLRAANIKFE